LRVSVCMSCAIRVTSLRCACPFFAFLLPICSTGCAFRCEVLKDTQREVLANLLLHLISISIL